MSKKIISIKKVVKYNIGKTRAEKYLKGIDVLFSGTATTSTIDIYQTALSALLEGESEKALNCIIFGLDIDRENQLLLHLCKTMLFSLGQYATENNFEALRSKYASKDSKIEDSFTKLKKKIREMAKIISSEEDKLENTEKKLMTAKKNPIIFLFKKNSLQKEIQGYKTNISNYNDEKEQSESELEKLDDFVHKEEYLKVVGLIIEICVFPSRFESELSKK